MLFRSRTHWISRGSPAVYLGPQEGQVSIGGGAWVLVSGMKVLIMPEVLTLVQQGGVSV